MGRPEERRSIIDAVDNLKSIVPIVASIIAESPDDQDALTLLRDLLNLIARIRTFINKI
jgi:hypothetical protein